MLQSKNYNASISPRKLTGTMDKDVRTNEGGEFYPIGDGLKIVDGKLTVDVVDAVEKDNTRPITSGAVYTTVGNIDALLQTI